MATVTGLTKDRMLEIEAASVVDAALVGDNLVLTRQGGGTIDVGNIRGPQGIQGPVGPAGDVTLVGAQTITGAKTFSAKVTITPPVGIGIEIAGNTNAMATGSVRITRSAGTAIHSLVFSGGIAVDFIIGRSANQDHLQLGINGGAGFVEMARLETDGKFKAIGSQNLFGNGAFGGDSSAVSIGQYDPDYALISAFQPVRANAGLFLQAKGDGVIQLRNGGAIDRYMQFEASGKVFMTTGGSGISSHGLEIYGSPLVGNAIILGRTNWGIGAGGNLIEFSNAAGVVFAVDANGVFYWGSGRNAAGLLVATASGGAGVLPAAPQAFMVISIQGQAYKIPVYNA